MILCGLSPKIFQISKPYAANDSGGFLTPDELFNALIHPKIGNFGTVLAAILTAIAQREARYDGNGNISIGVANGSSHLGFFQFRCRPADLNANEYKGGWVGDALRWFAPYNTEGELSNINPKQPDLSKKYAWEAFIQNQKTIKDIKKLLLTPDGKYKTTYFKSALGLLGTHMPKVKYWMKIGEYDWNKRGSYDETDYIHDIVTVNGKQKEIRKENNDNDNMILSSAYIADWARIPANQILMLKSKFGLAQRFFNDNKIVNYPYLQQEGLVELTQEQASNKPGSLYLLDHFAMRAGAWTTGVSYSRARDILAAHLMRESKILNIDTPVTLTQARESADKSFTLFAGCLSGTRKDVYYQWLGPNRRS